MTVSDYDHARLISRVLHLYYDEGLTQSEVANCLELSTPKVNRLLQQARRQKMVKITIQTPFQHLFDLESALQKLFGIHEAVVVPAMGDNAASMVNFIGRAGASYLLGHLKDGDVLAIGGGTTVHAVVEAIDTSRTFDVDVVPVVGGVQGNPTTDVNYLAAQLAERLGGRAYQLHTPAFVETSQQRETLLNMAPIKEILDIARRANVVLLGIGSVEPDISRFVQFTALSAEEMRQIATVYGGVGEVLAIVYDISGTPCAEPYANRVVGLTWQELVKMPLRIGVACTAAKALPIYGALRGGFFSTLITDEAAAQGVLDLYDRDIGRGVERDNAS